MGLLDNVKAVRRAVSGTRMRPLPDAVRLVARRPAIAAGVGVFETGLMASGRMPARLKALATLKTSALIGCPF